MPFVASLPSLGFLPVPSILPTASPACHRCPTASLDALPCLPVPSCGFLGCLPQCGNVAQLPPARHSTAQLGRLPPASLASLGWAWMPRSQHRKSPHRRQLYFSVYSFETFSFFYCNGNPPQLYCGHPPQGSTSAQLGHRASAHRLESTFSTHGPHWAVNLENRIASCG